MNRKTYMDCYVIHDSSKLVIGNDLVERSWVLNRGMPVPVSVLDKRAGIEWVENSNKENDACPFSFSHPSIPAADPEFNIIGIGSEVDNDIGVGKEHLKVHVVFGNTAIQIKWELLIYPGLPVIRSRFWVKAGLEQQTGHNIEDNSKLNTANATKDVIEHIAVKSLHCKWKTVSIRAVSDSNNNLVSEEHGLLYPHEQRRLTGNLMFLKHTLNESGLILIKESPYASEQITDPGGDFYMKGTNIYVTGTGIASSDISANQFIPAYGSALCIWRGGEIDALMSLKAYHEARHKFNAQTDCFVMSNTWGDRSSDSKIYEDFLLTEFKAANEVGITHYQIDAGWQQSAEKSSGYNIVWEFDKSRFPHDVKGLMNAAEKSDLKIGLWFTPYMLENYKYWKEEAEGLISLYKKYGITHFKVDGFKIESHLAEENLVNMMRMVISQTDGAASFNIDITNWKRLGYFGQTQYGTIFLENRYTDWHSYFPHYTLRNLWTISKYFPSYRLQTEFLNVGRNRELYEGDPFAPYECGMEYAFAVTMFSNPLAWFEPTGLSTENKKILGGIIPKYREHQAKIISGLVLPLGDEPDGTSWTGFQSITGVNQGYILIIRENNNNNEQKFKLWDGFTDRTSFERVLGEDTKMILDENRILNVKLSKPYSYALYMYKSAS